MTRLESIRDLMVLGHYNFLIITGFGRGLMGLDRVMMEVYFHQIWLTKVVPFTAIQSWEIGKYTSPAELSNFRGQRIGLEGGARKV